MSDLANAPTPERARRSAFVSAPAIGTETAPARAGARMYRALSPVERMLRDGAIEPRQADAGQRLREDFELGVAGARDDAGGSGGSPGWYYPEARLAALRRYRHAVAGLGPHLWRYIGAVAVAEHSISEVARMLKRNRQEVVGVVKVGLDVLADHYEGA